MSLNTTVAVSTVTLSISKGTRVEAESSLRHTQDNTPTRSYMLPDLLRNWPYKRQLVSPHRDTVKAESMDWLDSFHLFTPASRKAFDKCEITLFTALVYPLSTHDTFRSCNDLNYTFFVLDDLTDVLDAEETRNYCNASMDAILHPNEKRPSEEPIIGEISRQFWIRASADAPEAFKQRFVKSWQGYLDSVVLQAQRRGRSRYICSVEEYMTSRRLNVGCLPAFAFLELSLGIDIPQNVMDHPWIVSITMDATDMVLLANDIHSYKKEILTDDADYNAVTVVMKDGCETLEQAMQTIADMHDRCVEHFLQARDEILSKRDFPSFGERIDNELAAYIDGLGQYVYGNVEWMFASGRYFGDKGVEIKETRKVIIA